MLRFAFTATLLVCVSVVCVLALRSGSETESSASRLAFLSEAVAVMPPFSPIVSVPNVPTSTVAGRVKPRELVIGVTVNGASRAYPLNMVDTPERKVINDNLGGEPILITWCDRCHTAAAFSRRVDGEVLEFGCSGLLWQGALVIYDQKTESFWNHVLGKAVAGSLEGTRLQPISSAVDTWERWSAAHPDGTALVTDRVTGALDSDYYTRSHQLQDFVLGINAGHPEAWSFDMLSEVQLLHTERKGQPVAIVFDPQSHTARMFLSRVDGADVTFRMVEGLLEDPATGTRWDPVSGRNVEGAEDFLTLLPAITSFKDSWRTYFPESTIHEAPSRADR